MKNTHWHQPLTLNFDSETMPKWFGLPDPGTLPSTFSIEYVRAWKRLDGPPDESPHVADDIDQALCVGIADHWD